MNPATTRGTPMTRINSQSAHALLAAAALAAAVLGAAGCRGDREDKPPRQFFPDMDDQPKFHPQAENEFFADGRTMRVPPAGTVAFGRTSFVSREPWAAHEEARRADLLKADPVFYTGSPDGGKTWVERVPVEVTMDLLHRGQDRYNIYCVVCHGYTGDGKGAVGVSFNPVVPTFHDPKYSDPSDYFGRDGYLFHTAMVGKVGGDGKQTMPAYAHAVSERDAWAIVAYIRALQAARSGSLSDVPQAMRETLERTRPPAATPPPPASNPPQEPPQQPAQQPGGPQ